MELITIYNASRKTTDEKAKAMRDTILEHIPVSTQSVSSLTIIDQRAETAVINMTLEYAMRSLNIPNRIIPGSEMVFVNGLLLAQGHDYNLVEEGWFTTIQLEGNLSAGDVLSVRFLYE